MAGTYSQIYIQIVFAVKGREKLLQKQWRDDLFKYMCGIITRKDHKAIIVNGVSDHVPLFVGLKPSLSISDLVRAVKNNSTKHINEIGWLKGKFSWQEGYGAFSYSQKQIENVYEYILNQEEHHRGKSFKEEYISFLEIFKIQYKDQYLFDWIN